MTRTLLPILLGLCATVAAAQPGQHPGQPQPSAEEAHAPAQIVQASLVMPGSGQAMRGRDAGAAARASAADPSDDPVQEEGERSASLMLAAALALMTGIALRRWFSGQQ